MNTKSSSAGVDNVWAIKNVPDGLKYLSECLQTDVFIEMCMYDDLCVYEC